HEQEQAKQAAESRHVITGARPGVQSTLVPARGGSKARVGRRPAVGWRTLSRIDRGGAAVPLLAVNDVELDYESVGDGYPLVFSHEFGGDRRSWEPQVRHFARWYRCIAYSHRGFPPSSVPEAADAYSQEQLVEDLRALLGRL